MDKDTRDRDPFEGQSYGFGDSQVGKDSAIYDKDEERKNRPPEPEKKGKKKGGGRIIALALIFSLIGGLVGSAITSYKLSQGDRLIKNSGGGQQVVIEGGQQMTQVEAVATAAMPAVVGITVETTQMTPFGPAKAQGTGSGFIISENGYILSNAHVVGVGNTGTVNVLLSDGSEIQGQVVWSDDQLDLGLVKIDREGLPYLDMGNSESVRIGQLAVAIGNPLGLDFQRSVTAGVISGLNRNIGEVEGNYMDGLIQTDASINSGNSGGPLLNGGGQVIGINTAKIQGGEGLGFAIPINTVRPIIEEVIKTGDYKAVSLGVSAVSVEEIERRFGVDFATDHQGVMVASVAGGSPAEAAGLKRSDIILKLGERDLSSMSELRRALYDYQAGDQERLKVQRQGETLELTVTFSDYELSQENFID
ncbi:MAG: trypsin-like peptidase domain-containing protein [Tissierellia bacterium]|nr:trypsin-like peptidase domain-containing protein [Tissierellia bacterium]